MGIYFSAHKNVRLFITHGGLLSAQEAIYHGVPIVGIPVYGDQSLNMNKAEVAGYGLKLDMKNVTKESILWAVQKVLHDPRYVYAMSHIINESKNLLNVMARLRSM
jgi:glucuronosyltransferase